MAPALPAVDLRSDTVTRPTAAMRRAIAEAEVGDDVLGDDPTVQTLQQRVARLLGKEAALFFPSGTQANQTGILLHAGPGTEVICEAGAHIYHYEMGAASAWAGCQMRPVPTGDGVLTPEAVRAHIRPKNPHLPTTALVAMENTHSKGLGCPIGSALAGPRAAIERARTIRKRLGAACGRWGSSPPPRSTPSTTTSTAWRRTTAGRNASRPWRTTCRGSGRASPRPTS